MDTCNCDCAFEQHHFSSHMLDDGTILNRLTCHDHPDCAEEHHDAVELLTKHGVTNIITAEQNPVEEMEGLDGTSPDEPS